MQISGRLVIVVMFLLVTVYAVLLLLLMCTAYNGVRFIRPSSGDIDLQQE